MAETSTTYLPSPEEVALKEKVAAGEFIDDTSFFTDQEYSNLRILKAGFAKGYHFNTAEDTKVTAMLPRDLQPLPLKNLVHASIKEMSPPTEAPSRNSPPHSPSVHHDIFSFFHHERSRNIPETHLIFHQEEHHTFRDIFNYIFHSGKHHQN